MSKSYAEKLKDPRWQKKRLEIMERDKFTCLICSSIEKTLHVHHRWYERGREPWDYEAHVYQTLCEECHEMMEIKLDNVRAYASRGLVEANELELIINARNATSPLTMHEQRAAQLFTQILQELGLARMCTKNLEEARAHGGRVSETLGRLNMNLAAAMLDIISPFAKDAE